MKGAKNLLVIATISIVGVGVGIDAAVLAHRRSPDWGEFGNQVETSPSQADTEPTTPALAVHTPGGEVSPDDVRFAWSPLDTMASYKILLLDDHARPVWSRASIDTAIRLPRSVKLEAGETYYWMVDGVTPAGDTRTTGLRQFVVMRAAE